MGAVTEADVIATVGAIEKALARSGASVEPGVGLSAAASALRT
jgi:aspartate aminotransferase-like enzyme